MEKKPVQAAARTLRVLVTLAFVLGLLAVGFSPVLAGIHGAGIPLPELMDSLTAAPPPPGEDWPYFSPSMLLFFAVAGGWTERFSYTLVLTLFLAAAGLCAAGMLRQGRRVLGHVLAGEPFHPDNARSLRQAAGFCFGISAASLSRVVWGLFSCACAQPLRSYTALFVPAFLMGGLLLRLMFALFRQAAQLKAENDLTI
jgi:hypothetical protein